MRLQAVAREVWSNVASGTARIATLALLASAIGAGLSVVDLSVTRSLIADARTFRAAGSATLTLIAEGRIDGAACRALGEVDGVVAAGALRAGPAPLVAGVLPSAPIAAYETTPGFVATLGATGGGVVVAEEVAETLNLRPGADLAFADGKAVVGGVYRYPDDGRRPGFGWAALMETADDRPFDECWVLVWPQSDAVRSLMLGVASPGAESPQLGQLNTTRGSEFGGRALLATRVTSWAPLASALLVGSLAFVAVRTRRLAFASDLHAGARRRDVFFVAAIEGIFWLTPSLLMALGVCALLVAPEAMGDRGALMAQGARIAIATFAGGCAGLGAGVISVREHQLLTYFKDR